MRTEWILTAAQRRRLERELSETRDARAYRRLLAVLQVGHGRSVGEVALELGVTRQSLYNWLSVFVEDGDPQVLFDGERAGRPTIWTEQLHNTLKKAMTKSPIDMGYAATGWTVPLLQRHLEEETGCKPSDSSVRRELDELGYAWKRSQYMLCPDPEWEKKKTDSPKTAGIACAECGVV